MRPLVLIGAGKFALEVTRYIEEETRGGNLRRVVRYLALEGEEVVTPPEMTRDSTAAQFDAEVGLVFAGSEPQLRLEYLSQMDAGLRRMFVNVIHPSSTIPEGAIEDPGVILGPQCHVGTDTRIGAFTVMAYMASIGPCAQVGEGNFFSPGCHCGSSVVIEDHNFFGMACTILPGLRIGTANQIQAGSLIVENIGHQTVGAPTQRTKFIPQKGQVR